jgi:hypothetical protein
MEVDNMSQIGNTSLAETLALMQGSQGAMAPAPSLTPQNMLAQVGGAGQAGTNLAKSTGKGALAGAGIGGLAAMLPGGMTPAEGAATGAGAGAGSQLGGAAGMLGGAALGHPQLGMGVGTLLGALLGGGLTKGAVTKYTPKDKK